MTTRTLVLAGGCFWGMQEMFSALAGVHDTVVGYTGGAAETANYPDVCTGRTGHAEAVLIEYDPRILTEATLFEIFFTAAHDPTQVNGQGNDIGTQYRSAIFTTTVEQREAAEAAIAQFAPRFRAPIATTVQPLQHFYPAEAEHQHYAARNPTNPYILLVDRPKMQRLEQLFPSCLAKRESR